MAKNRFKLKIGGKSILSITHHEGLTVTFSDNSVLTLIDEHRQDCCERVYANWNDVDMYVPQLLAVMVDAISIIPIKEEGFLLCFSKSPTEKIFIGCHNEQNGYYGSDLVLNVKYQDVEAKIDLTGCTKYTETY